MITETQKRILRRNALPLYVTIFDEAFIKLDSDRDDSLYVKNVKEYINCEADPVIQSQSLDEQFTIVESVPLDSDFFLENGLSAAYFSNDFETWHKIASFDNEGVYFAVLFEKSLSNPFGRKCNGKFITSPAFVSYRKLADEWVFKSISSLIHNSFRISAINQLKK